MRKNLLLTVCALVFFVFQVTAAEIKGVVKNPSGEPLSDVIIFYQRSMLTVKTDVHGVFSVPAKSKVLFFRLEGYHPFTKVLDSSSTDLEVVMAPVKASDIALPKCTLKNLKEKRVGNSIKFLPSNGAKTSKGSDVDYSNYVISKKIGKRKVWMSGIHGPIATLGVPSEKWILDAAEFTERSYNGRYFSDTRGRDKDGSYWRYIGAFGEDVEYSGLTAEEAKYFDAIIDTACRK